MQGMKSLVIVEMVMQNIVTRVTYRVTSTLPIGMILPKVSLYPASKIGYVGASKLQFFSASCCCLKNQIGLSFMCSISLASTGLPFEVLYLR